MVIAYFWLLFPDVWLEDLRLALTDCEERRRRDHDSEYQVLRPKEADDPTVQEDLSFVMRAPWPFADREVLQRRWQLKMEPEEGRGEGLAVVMRSFDEEGLLLPRQDRVRAHVHKSAYLLRPLGRAADPGIELVVSQQIDIGGLCPAWAQRFLTRFAVQQGVDWAKKLREYCVVMHKRREAKGQDGAEAQATPRKTVSADPCVVPEVSTCPGSPSRGPLTGEEVLDSILTIERRCCGVDLPDGLHRLITDFGRNFQRAGDDFTDLSDEQADTEQGDDLTVECLLDEPTAKYCLCASLDSPVVIGYIRIVLCDVYPGDVWRALVSREERLLRDPDSEYQVLRKSQQGEQLCEEDVAFVWRAPWPFWDRDVLERRWTFPLHGGEGLAIVMRSFEDELLLPTRSDRVRAFVHKCGYLLRPLDKESGGAGLELTVCQQVDLGGLCPDWAQEVLTRWAVNRGLQWAEELREHCNKLHSERSECEPAPRFGDDV